MLGFQFLQTCAAFLALEKIFQLARLAQTQGPTGPIKDPRAFAARPFRNARIVLGQPGFYIRRQTDICVPRFTEKDVDLTHPEGWLRGRDLNPRSRSRGIMSRADF